MVHGDCRSGEENFKERGDRGDKSKVKKKKKKVKCRETEMYKRKIKSFSFASFNFIRKVEPAFLLQ